MKETRDKRDKKQTDSGSNGKPSKEKIEDVRRRLFKEYSKAWEELADH